MRVRLVNLTPDESRATTVISQLPAVLGRNADANVRLDDCWVSRVHCEISEISGTLLVRDLDSKNGTMVNGQYIKEAHLFPGDQLTVGLTSFQVQYTRRRSRFIDRQLVMPGEAGI